MPLRFTHIGTCVSGVFLFVVEQSSTVWVYHSLSIHRLKNKTTINIHIQVVVCIKVVISPQSGITSSYNKSMFNCMRNCFPHCFSKVAMPFCFCTIIFYCGPFACLAITALVSFSLPTYILSFSLATALFGKVFSDPRSGLIHLLCSVILLYVYIFLISVA